MGVVGMTVPEPYGGLGLGAVDVVGLLEESGRFGLPEPLVETTALVVPLLVDIVTGGGRVGRAGEEGRAGGGDGQVGGAGEDGRAGRAGDALRRIAAGDAIAAVVPDIGSPAPWTGDADLVVAFESGRVVLASADEVEARPVRSVDPTRRLAEVSIRAGAGSGAGAGSVLAVGAEADHHLARLRCRGAFATGAVLLGAADRLISTTCGYAIERRQFGRPIGSFQAVKHHLAGAHVKLEMARPVTYKAAWSLDDDPDSARRDCSMAKATASEAALEAARVALQVHGAIGYTWEHDIHLWMKRVWVLAASWGDSASHFASVLDSLVGPASSTSLAAPRSSD